MRLSVVTPVYNGEPFLVPAIESILNQTHRDFSFVLVDGGSTDNSLAVMQHYAHKDPRIRLLTPGPVGLCNALNLGVAATNADWIFRLDADDIALPNRLKRQLQAVHRWPDAAVIGSFVNHINREGKALSEWRFGPMTETKYRQMVESGDVPQVIHSSAVLNRRIFDLVGGYDQQFAGTEDYDLFDRMAQHGLVIAVPEVLAQYRVHRGSLSDTHFLRSKELARYVVARRARRMEGDDLTFEAFRQEAAARPLWTRFRESMRDHQAMYYRRGGMAYGNGDRLSMLWYMGLATMMNPLAVLSRVWTQKLSPQSRQAVRDAAFHTTGKPVEFPHNESELPDRKVYYR